MDGNITMKTILKVEDSRSMASIEDVEALRYKVLALYMLGGYYEINTMRTAIVPGPSYMASEGLPIDVKVDGQNYKVNPIALCEISSALHEQGIYNLTNAENSMIYQNTVYNGLGGGITVKPGQPIDIKDPAKKFAGLIDVLSDIKTIPGAPNGFLSRLDEIYKNEEEGRPLRVLEKKALPAVFFDKEAQGKLKAEDYLKVIDLAKQSRQEKWSSAKFIAEYKKSGIWLPSKYETILDPSDPDTEEKFTTALRRGSIVCLTPHAFDSYNIIRSDLKLKIYQDFAKFARSPEARAWAEKWYLENYGEQLPPDVDIFTINGKDVSMIDFENKRAKDGTTFENVDELVAYLKDNAPSANIKHCFAKITENGQPYCEISTASDKSDVLPSYEAFQKNNSVPVGSGDSPSDSNFLADCIASGGIALVTRGLMSKFSIAETMVERLTLAKFKMHPMALELLPGEKPNGRYRSKIDGVIKTREEWANYLLEDYGYKKKILLAENIHQNNQFNYEIFKEVLKGEQVLDPKKPWIQEARNMKSVQDLVTPDCGIVQDLKDMVYEKPIVDRIGWLGRVPWIRKFLHTKNISNVFNTLFHITSKTLIFAAPLGVVAKLSKSTGMLKFTKIAQRLAYAVNNIASGGVRGMIVSKHKFWWQSIGEAFGLFSTFYKQNSVWGQTLRALANLVLVGRANELIMREGINLDKYENEKEAKKNFSEDGADKFLDIKKSSKRHTEGRIEFADYLQNKFMGGALGKIPLAGRAISETLADLRQACHMAIEFIKEPGLRKGGLGVFFKAVGQKRMSKNSGKPYHNVHSPAHHYSFVGLLTAATSIMSTVLGKATGSKLVDNILTDLANLIPAWGMVAAARIDEQKVPGTPERFTDVNKRNRYSNLEESGKFQKWGAWLQAAAAPLLQLLPDIGPELFNMGTGFYLAGIREKLVGDIDDAQALLLTRQGRYYQPNIRDLTRPEHIDQYVKDFHAQPKAPEQEAAVTETSTEELSNKEIPNLTDFRPITKSQQAANNQQDKLAA